MLLIKYMNANEGLFDKTVELLESFNTALRTGTINPADLTDPSGLYWKPRSAEDSDTLLQLITHYSDWLAMQPEYGAVQANPFRKATSAEQRVFWCAYYHKNDNVFLNHLSSEREAASKSVFSRQVQRQGRSPVNLDEVKKFPEEHINRLLDEGFVRAENINNPDPNMRVDFKGRAITLLMHHGGVRKSEVFHLYLDDISIDNKRLEAVVRIYHPSEGAAPEKQYGDRREYLMKKFQRSPRTMYLKSERLHAGWKAPVLSSREKYFKVEFFPPHKATEFLYAFQQYLKYQRVEPDGHDHPYAFTNSTGQPETIKNFQRLHRAAVHRIGLAHEKYRGTTEHGHRHAFGYRLAEHGFTQIEIQKMMRHRSPTSCLVYTQPTNEDLRKTMERRVEK